jgi:alkylation response protein AidB-like acyl-CoA dehydrogenase
VEEFRRRARAWLEDHAAGAPPNYGAIMPPELRDQGVVWQRLLFDSGWAGLHWPVEHGGQGLDPDYTAVWIDECANAQVPPFINMVGIVLAGGALLRYGTEEQQHELLKPTLRGDIVWCQLFSEPGAGSDLAGLSTRAESRDGGFVVNGQKVWCSAGRCSDYGILLARTDPSVAKHRGISFFVMPMHEHGVEVRPLRQMTGGSEFDEVFFTDVALPPTALVGRLNDGWNVAMSVLSQERGHVGASVRGVARRLDELTATGRSATLTPPQRSRLVELYGRGRAYTQLGQRSASNPVAGSLMKLGVTELLFESAMLTGDIAGIGGLADDRVTGGMLAAPGGRIAGGTSQIQRNIIGERILGLPKEPS